MATFNLTLTTVLSEIIVPYGYTDNDASVFGFWVNIVGNFGGVLSSAIIAKTGNFKCVTIALILLSVVFSVVFQMCVMYIPAAQGYWPVCLSLYVLFFFNMGIYTYCMEYAIKLAPNIGESISGGTII